jgi:hypothetical protein
MAAGEELLDHGQDLVGIGEPGHVVVAVDILFDPYTLLTNNEYRWIAEERIAFSCPRPAAINLVTGLPTS